MIEDLKDKKVLEWLNQNPKATKEQQLEYRASLNLTTADLSSEQQAMLKSYAEVARQIQVKGNKQALDDMMKDILTYEQQRLKITEEYEKKRESLYETDKDGNKKLRKGVTQGNVDELNRAEQEAYKGIDEQFAQREETYQAWGDKVKDIVADVMKRMLVSKFLEEPLGEIFDKYKAKWFKDGQFVGLDAVIQSMSGFASDLNAVGTDFAKIWENLPENVKSMFEVTADATREASQKGIATASQESVDELNGRATAIQGHTYSIAENTKIILSVVNMILQSVLNIEKHTENMAGRIERIESSVKETKDTVNDFALKGIKMI